MTDPAKNPANQTMDMDWMPGPPSVDSSTAGRGAYNTHLDGIAAVNSIGQDSTDTYSNKSSYPAPKL